MLRELYEETRVIAHIERLALLTTDPDVVYPNGDKCQSSRCVSVARYFCAGEAEVGDGVPRGRLVCRARAPVSW